MENFVSVISWIGANYQLLLSSLVLVLGGLTGIFMLIPGDQPEKAFKSVAAFLEKFSKKAQ